MDPVLAAATELWWIIPVAAGAGAAGVAALHRWQRVNGKRLGYDAAKLELHDAQRDARSAAVAARLARAETSRVVADRAASRADAAAVASARRALREAQLASKAALAQVKAARVRVSAERAGMGAGGLPLDRLHARHDAVLTRWMRYETDPAAALAFPKMSDARDPHTAVFLAALEQARDRRPSRESARVTASDFSAYRRAVDELERAFDAAERSARGENVQPDLPGALRDAARTVMERSTEALNRTADALGQWNARRRDR
ncbi:hypothetical protein [Microbacterium terrisoli]|uniref:hypothetical protein n=1 Tax=Microbacterium terrisoli TaxID=3242192 RepID=UPI0028061036|nr:hypothetical protein [Microbacterium protaetiae]